MESRAERGAAAGRGETSSTAEGSGDWRAQLARYQPVALRLARGIVASADLAEDVVQETLCSVLQLAARGGARFESPAHARSYFLRAVHNRAVDALRNAECARVAAGEPEELASPAPHGSQAAAEEQETHLVQVERVRRALEALRTVEREAVRLRYLEGLSYQEISERTGTAISTLHSRVETALARIRERIGKEGGLP